jgi:hypothetical protein
MLSWLNYLQTRAQMVKISGVAGDQAFKTSGERADQHIRNRTAPRLLLSLSKNELRPQLMGQHCIRRGPWFQAINTGLLEKMLLPGQITVKNRANFHIGNRADQQSVSQA